MLRFLSLRCLKIIMEDITKENLKLIFGVIFFVITMVFALTFSDLLILFDEKFITVQGIKWTIVGISIAMVFFVIEQHNKEMTYLTKQKLLLKSILSDVYFLTKKGGHIEFFKNSIKPRGYPHHNMREIDAGFYWNNLNNKIDGKITFPLKHLLAHTNDKIVMLNNYRESEQRWKEKMNYAKQEVIPDLEDKLNKIKEEINCKFKVCLTQKEKEKIDDLINR